MIVSRRRKKKRVRIEEIFILLIILLICFLAFRAWSRKNEPSEMKVPEQKEEIQETKKEKKKEETEEKMDEPEEVVEPENSSEQILDGGVYTKDGIIVVNKKHGVSNDYAPGEDPVAGDQIRKLIYEMQSQGYDISNSYSGFRSYETQAGLYQNYVNAYGQEQADTFSAKPGYSEHQTGLAFDLMNTSGALVTTVPEATWIAQNAHKYGFIVRYQEGKESITGYMAEPWHLRYIGDKAEDVYKSGLTLEEYLGVEGGTSY